MRTGDRMVKSLTGLIFFVFSVSSAAAQGVDQRTEAIIPPVPVPPETIRDKPIYTYSFLDLREAEYTRKVLEKINTGLADRLDAVNAGGPILEYRKTPQGEFLLDGMAIGSSSTAVPVREVIDGNKQAEATAGTKLRLVIFPMRYDVVGARRWYDIRWMLFEIGSQRPFWNYTYSGSHVVMWSNKENADARAKKILDAVFDDMKAKGLF